MGKSFEVNMRVVYSMRSCGQGFAGLEKFNFGMNMPKPMTRRNYDKLSCKIKNACKQTAFETMREAASNLEKDDEVTDTSISADGSHFLLLIRKIVINVVPSSSDEGRHSLT